MRRGFAPILLVLLGMSILLLIGSFVKKFTFNDLTNRQNHQIVDQNSASPASKVSSDLSLKPSPSVAPSSELGQSGINLWSKLEIEKYVTYKIPVGWKKELTNEGTTLTIFSPNWSQKGYSGYVGFSGWMEGLIYKQKVEDLIAQKTTDRAINEKCKNTKIDKAEGLSCINSLQDVTYYEIYLINGGNGWRFGFTVSSVDLEKNISDIDAFISSIKFK